MVGKRQLVFPGPGDSADGSLPPGSIVIPLEKAPSGHLVMVLDDFERLAVKAGGVPESQLQLHTSSGSFQDLSVTNSLNPLETAEEIVERHDRTERAIRLLERRSDDSRRVAIARARRSGQASHDRGPLTPRQEAVFDTQRQLNERARQSMQAEMQALTAPPGLDAPDGVSGRDLHH